MQHIALRLIALSSILPVLMTSCGGGNESGAQGSVNGGASQGWGSGTYEGPSFKLSGMEDGAYAGSLGRTPDGSLWVSQGGKIAHVDRLGNLQQAWTLSFANEWIAPFVVTDGLESKVELGAHKTLVPGQHGAESSWTAWGPITAQGALPSEMKRLWGLSAEQDGYAGTKRFRVDGPAGFEWFARSSGYGEAWLAKLTAAGDIGWSRGFQGLTYMGQIAGGGHFFMANNDDFDRLEVARVSATGTITYQRSIAWPGDQQWNYEWPSEHSETSTTSSLLLHSVGDSAAGSPIHFARLDISSGQVAAAWTLRLPTGSEWHSIPSVETTTDGDVMITGVVRPNPLLVENSAYAGAGLLVYRYTSDGSLIWKKLLRVGPSGSVPFIAAAYLLSGHSKSLGNSHVVRWTAYPDAEIKTLGSSNYIDWGEPLDGFSCFSMVDGSSWSRSGWGANPAYGPSKRLAPFGGGNDVVLARQDYINDRLEVARFTAGGGLRWSRLAPESLDFIFSYIFSYGDVTTGYQYEADEASPTGTSSLYSVHELGLTGPTAFLMGSTSPLRWLPPWPFYSSGADSDIVIGSRSTSLGYQPLIARLDSNGRPEAPCMGQTLTYGESTTPGVSYSLVVDNAPTLIKSALSVTVQNQNFETPTGFYITTEPLEASPASVWMQDVCD